MPCARIQTCEWRKRKVGEGYPDEKQLEEVSPWDLKQGPVLDGRSVVRLLWNLWQVGWFSAMGVTPHREDGDRTVEEIMIATGEVVNLNINEYVHVEATTEWSEI